MNILIFSFLVSLNAFSDREHSVLRRLAVLPVFSDSIKGEALEKIWWNVRDEITKHRRILIASKEFLIRKKVFFPKEKIDSADAVLLGRLLDAEGILTVTVRKGEFKMSVRDGNSGTELWSKTKVLDKSNPVAHQVETGAITMIHDFLASIPYHAFVIVDPLVGSIVYEEGNSRLVKIDLISKGKPGLGDPVQWIEVHGERSLFQGGGKITVLAEGVVVKVEDDILTVDIRRARKLSHIKERSLIRLPREVERFQKDFALKEAAELEPELLREELTPPMPENQDSIRIATALSAIIAVAGFVLLGF